MISVRKNRAKAHPREVAHSQQPVSAWQVDRRSGGRDEVVLLLTDGYSIKFPIADMRKLLDKVEGNDRTISARS